MNNKQTIQKQKKRRNNTNYPTKLWKQKITIQSSKTTIKTIENAVKAIKKTQKPLGKETAINHCKTTETIYVP